MSQTTAAAAEAPVRAPPVLTTDAAATVPTWRAAYSDRTCAVMAAFAELAYLPFEEGAGPAPTAGAPRAERPGGKAALATALAGGGFTLAGVFNRDDTQAYLAVRHDEFAVLAFRGTTDFSDWRTNLNVGRTPLPGRPDILVHRGFLSAFECCRAEILQAIDRETPPDLGLYITGHSLGGALAQIASAVLERDNLAACYTFGSPRVGVEGFDRVVKCPHYRVVNNWDVVPGIPFATPWGYRHSGDPRLLVPSRKAQEALRHDRDPFTRTLIDLWAAAVAPIRRRFLVVDDHMIWNYRTQLEAIAVHRAGRI